MKKLYSLILSTLVMLAGCGEINDRLDALEGRVDAIENTQIATISQQITSINNSILLLNNTDKELSEYITALETEAENLQTQLTATNTKIDEVKQEILSTISSEKAAVLAELEAFRATVNGELDAIKAVLETLKAKDAELDGKIATLQEYVDTELKATEDWATATFATLEQYNEVVATIATIEGAIEGLNESISALETRINEKIAKDIETACATLSADLQKAVEEVTEEYTAAIATATEEITAAYTAKLESSISALETSVKEWVNEQLTGYYTIAEMDAKLEVLEKTCNNKEVEAEIAALREQLVQAKKEITQNYQSAITEAINTNNGVIDAKISAEIATVNEKIAGLENILNSLENRVGALEDLVEELISQKLEIIFDEIDDVAITAGGHCEIGYTITSSEGEVHIATVAQNGWKATVKKTSSQTGYITVYAPNPLTSEPIMVFVSDANTTIMRTLTFVDGITTIATKSYSLAPSATTLSVGVQTNMDYEVVIPSSAQSWIFLQSITTRASMRNDSINLSVAENTTTTSRSATLQLVCNDVEVGTIQIYQQGIEIANNEIAYTTTDGKAITLYQTMGFAANIVSHTYSNGKGLIVFDKDITSISEYAFYKGSTLKSIQMPQSIKKIGEYAFSGCSSLTSVTIPDSVTLIGDNAFYECTSIASVVIGNGVNSIGNYAFSGCSSLTSVTIPDSVTSIGEQAFYYCKSLASVTIGEGVTSIGVEAFYYCESLASVTIGEGVSSIESGAFYRCHNLKIIYCKPTTPPAIYYDSNSYCFPFNSVMNIYVPRDAYNDYMQYSSDSAANISQRNWYRYETYIKPYDFVPGIDGGSNMGFDEPNQPNPEQPEKYESGLGVIGSFAAGSDWTVDVPLQTTKSGILVAKNIAFNAYEEFKIRTVGTWADGNVNMGSGDVNYFTPNSHFTAVDQGGSIIVAQAGTYDIYYNTNTKRIYIMTAGTDISAASEQTSNGPQPDASTMSWGLVGAFNNWSAPDVKLEWNGTMYVAKGVTLSGEFKVRADETWTDNFGNGVNVTVGTATTVYYNGGNCKVANGTYDVYFLYNTANINDNGKLWVMTAGAEAPSL